MRISWRGGALWHLAEKWRERMRIQMGAASEKSMWWSFVAAWAKEGMQLIHDFGVGRYRFSPIQQYRFSHEAVRMWFYPDHLMIHLIFKLIQLLFKYFISPLCVHLSGLSSIRSVTADIHTALRTQAYRYVLRLDIRSYLCIDSAWAVATTTESLFSRSDFADLLGGYNHSRY